MSPDTNDYFHKDFQRALVAHLIRFPGLLEQLRSGKVSQDDVDLPIHKAVLQAASEIVKVQKGYGENGVPMQLLALQLKSMINAGVIYKEEKRALCDEVDRMYGMDLNPEYFTGILSMYLSEIRIKKLIKGYKAGSAKSFADSVTLAVETATPEDDGGIIIHPLRDIELSNTPIIGIPCGISSIDSRMGGGLAKQEFGVICGMTGLGKTTLAVNFCWGAAMTKRAALITLEIPGSKIRERLYSRITQVDYSRIRSGDNGDMTQVNRELRELLSGIPDETKNNFVIWDYSQKSCTLKDIERRLSRERDNGTLPDMVFLDWLDALGSDPSDRNNGFVAKELRHQLLSYSEGCSELAKAYNVAFWATTQSNKGGDGQRQIRVSNAAEGFSKAWRCSVFLGIGASDEDRANGRMTVKAGKTRDGAPFETQIQARLDKQTFEDIPPDISFAVPGTANFTPINDRENDI